LKLLDKLRKAGMCAADLKGWNAFQYRDAVAHFLLGQGLSPKTINCRLDSVRGFFTYLNQEEGNPRSNPVKKGAGLRLARPLPRYLKDEEVARLFSQIKKLRDRAIFMLMLRCGLRVEEVAHLRLQDLDLSQRRILVCQGKGNKDRVVYVSPDAERTLRDYLNSRSSSKEKQIFLVHKGTCRGKPISVRGIQKRMEYYARKAGLEISCHHLRHTMATQLLKRRCRSGYHPGSFGTLAHQNNAEICENLERQSPKGL
jgi:site-specific recombinase XerD